MTAEDEKKSKDDGIKKIKLKLVKAETAKVGVVKNEVGGGDGIVRRQVVNIEMLKRLREKNYKHVETGPKRRRPKTFRERWRNLIADNKLRNQARWMAIIIGYGFVNLLTIFLATYSYFLDMMEQSRFMSIFITYGTQHSQELVFLCFLSSLLTFTGFIIACASVELRHQINLKTYVKYFALQEFVHTIIMTISSLMYIKGWKDSRIFLRVGEFL